MVSYATITGTVHYPGSSVGVRCLITAVPRTRSAGLSVPDGLLYGVVAKVTDDTGALPSGADTFKIPLTDDPVVWSFWAEPIGPERGGPGSTGLQRWNFYNGEITASTALQALAETAPTALQADFPPGVLAQINGILGAAEDAAAAAAASAADAHDVSGIDTTVDAVEYALGFLTVDGGTP